MAFGHFPACAGFVKNIFQVKVLDCLIVFLDISKFSVTSLEANIYLLAQLSCH